MRVGRHLAVALCHVPAALERFTADIQTAVAAVEDPLRHRNDIDANDAKLYVTRRRHEDVCVSTQRSGVDAGVAPFEVVAAGAVLAAHKH